MQAIEAESNPNPTGRSWKIAVTAGSAGAGAMAMLLAGALKAEPATLVEAAGRAVGQWGPMFVLCMAGMGMANGWGKRFVEQVQKNAEAQQKMADAVHQIAQRDDIAARERELLLNHVAHNMQRVLEKVERIEQHQLGAQAKVMAAAGER